MSTYSLLYNKLSDICPKIDAAAYGIICIDEIVPILNALQIAKISSLCIHPKSIICLTFPYYAEGSGNICKYARGYDYHLEIKNRLQLLIDFLKIDYPQNKFIVLVDNSPIPEVYTAWLSGCGILGLNNLLISKNYGSYIFIGTILSDLDIGSTPKNNEYCLKCKACIASCPTKALTFDGHKVHFRKELCVSNISQKKGVLTKEELQMFMSTPLVWGCDCCIDVCPYNQNPLQTKIPSFTNSLIYSLSNSDISGLSNKAFKEKYGTRSFAWRGKAVFERNIELKKNI